MLRTITPQELERLRAGQRRMRTAVALTLAGIVGFCVLLIKVNPVLPIPVGGLVGVGLSRLFITNPWRRLLAELGLSQPEASAILTAEREQRTGQAQQSPAQRAASELRTARTLLILGLIAVVLLVAAAVYIFIDAGKPSGEGSTTWLAISVFGGFASFVAAAALLGTANYYRKAAAARLQA